MTTTFTEAEKVLSDAWDRHLQGEFGAHDPDATIATMVASPRVNHVPVMTGGDGRAQLYEFYAKSFLPQLPPDLEMTPISRTIGQGRVVDELFARFTHTIPMDWLLPGIPPTGKRVEVVLVVIVQLEGDKIAHEHIYWDQASVLHQVGLLEPGNLPILGPESARSVTDRSIPLNGLIARARRA
jgi:carboxymethylenebutenolidase